jgi:hypothetical protein
MTEQDQPPTPDRLTELLDEGDTEEAVTSLQRLDTADTDTRRRALRAVREVAEKRPSGFETLATPLAAFLVDDDRAVRLVTAKLFVTLAKAKPAAVLPAVDALADSLADDEEFYYVRARCAEALGYIAVESPEEVTDPETLADLRIGLEFDEPEVKEKLAKALAYVAVGDPSRLRHHVSSLAEHLDDDSELVRYHLCTTLVAVGSEHPAKLTDTRDELRERLADENPYVRGRAAEVLGVLVRSPSADMNLSAEDLSEPDDEEDAFVADRIQFARNALTKANPDETVPDGIGTLDSIRETTDEVAEKIMSPGEDGECPHCGLALPENGPPMCPRCGAPY